MEKSSILKLFLERGYQLDLETLNFFAKNEVSFEKFLKEMQSKTLPSTITLNFVNSLLKNNVEIVSQANEKKTITVDELAKVYSQRFNIIRKILLSHLDLVNLLSINKIAEKTKQFSIIGIVTKREERNLTIADDTGEISVTVDKKHLDDILLNDVLGFNCEKNGEIHVKTIIFPDVPLRRNVKNLTEDLDIIFTEKITENIVKVASEKNNPVDIFTFVKYFGEKQIPENIKMIFLEKMPIIASISDLFSIFLFEGTFLKSIMKDRKAEDFLVSLFRKRYLNATPTIDSNLINNAYILEAVPDIIVVKGLSEAIQTNYKGTTLLTLSENTAWNINLRTREIIKINLT